MDEDMEGDADVVGGLDVELDAELELLLLLLPQAARPAPSAQTSIIRGTDQ
ncbi:MAG: hypothetical protein ACLQI7_03110 [Streptosporangiaceae bacterium]|jgi:hypothetical protein